MKKSIKDKDVVGGSMKIGYSQDKVISSRLTPEMPMMPEKKMMVNGRMVGNSDVRKLMRGQLMRGRK